MIRDTVPESNPDTATQNVLRIYFPNIDFANMPRHMNYRELPECMERLYKGVTEPRKRRPSTDDEQPETKRLRADNEPRWRGPLPGLAQRSLCWPGENPGERCRVYTGTRPLQSLESSASASLIQTDGSGGVACWQHWMVAFVYDDEVLICDGNNVNGNLVGKCDRLKVEEFNRRCFNNKKFLGEYKIPKQRVEENVDDIKYYGNYWLLINNCKDWLKALLKKMELRDCTPYTDAFSAVAYLTLGAVGIGTAWGIINYLGKPKPLLSTPRQAKHGYSVAGRAGPYEHGQLYFGPAQRAALYGSA